MTEPISCCRVSIDENLIHNAQQLLQENYDHLEQQAKLFSLLSSEVRLKIVKLFLNCEKMCVCDLSDVLEMKQSPISQHLRKLKDGGLLVNSREGMTVFYSLNEPMRATLSRVIEG